jgi:hypothetical protein
MKQTAWLVLVVSLASAGPLRAHHNLSRFDTTKAVRVKGTITQFEQINPHSFLFLDEKGPDGQTRRWALEGPSTFVLARTGFAKDVKVGDEVEVCGYLPKEPVTWQVADRTNGRSPAGRLINAEVLLMPDGTQKPWGDYGVHKCFAPGYTDQHSK